MVNVLAYTGGLNIPGARFRVRQYIPVLGPLGVSLTESPAALCSYPPMRRSLRPMWGVAHLASRAYDIACDRDSDVVLFQREMFSTFFTLERFTRKPRILDVDDAIWLYRDGHFAKRLAECSDVVMCGNAYIAEWFDRWCDRIEIVPTPVDTNRFLPLTPQQRPPRPVIGWSGTSGGFVYFAEVAEAIAQVLKMVPEAIFRVVSDAPPVFPAIPSDRIEYVRWSPSNEVTALQDLTVGLMPLDNTEWSLGKCSYKMLLYMACGVPVVVSPVGMNNEVLKKGFVGMGAASREEWVDAMITIIRDERLQQQMGQEGRRVVLKHYNLAGMAPRVADIMKEVAGKGLPAQTSATLRG